MICACCGSYVNDERQHVWRFELRDTLPGSDNASLMLGAALCQPCAMSVVGRIKDGTFGGKNEEADRDANRMS